MALFSHRKPTNLLLILILSLVALLIACGPAQPVSIEAPTAVAEEPIVVTEVDATNNQAAESEAEEEAEAPENSGDSAENEEAESEPDTAEAPDDVDDSAETAPPVNENRPVVRAKAGSEVLNRDGIPVGFTENGHAYIGNINAPVLIEEFSDYQCPFCGRFFEQTMGILKSAEIKNGDAVLIFRDFPLNFHAQAAAAANAARCAGEQGAVAYWDMHDQLFATLGNWSVANPTPLFVDYATTIGIDTVAFEGCVSADTYADAIQADLQAGQAAGVRGTPAFIINSEVLSGAQPYPAFQTAIAQAQSGESIVQQAEPTDVGEVPVPEPIQFSENFAGAMGDPNAPVTIIEFTDYQCPFCSRHSAETMPALIQEYVDQGRVYYILKDLPLDQLHPKARDAANAARCAGDQDAYWEMHDALFAQSDSWGNSADHRTNFVTMAAALGLETTAFQACVDADTYAQQVNENVLEAQSANITGTPFFVIDGFPVINGAQPFEVFQQVVGLAEDGELVNAIMDAQRRQQQQQQQEAQQQQAPPQPTGPVDVPLGDAFAIGEPDAPITIVEYTDLQCPFCQRHHTNTYPRIVQDYVETGLVRYVFKDFPLDNIHPQANLAAQAVRCAGEQEMYTNMHGLIFMSQNEWSGQPNADAIFTGYATTLGMDDAAFGECLSSNKYFEAVNADLQEGAGLGVRGTPAFFVNGQFVNGAQPFDVFQQIIDQQLAATE